MAPRGVGLECTGVRALTGSASTLPADQLLGPVSGLHRPDFSCCEQGHLVFWAKGLEESRMAALGLPRPHWIGRCQLGGDMHSGLGRGTIGMEVLGGGHDQGDSRPGFVPAQPSNDTATRLSLLQFPELRRPRFRIRRLHPSPMW